MAARVDSRHREGLARSNPQLLLHEIQAGHHLGHRVLDLEARVHLEEVETAVPVDEELDGPGVAVTASTSNSQGCVPDRLSLAIGEAHGRCLLDELLVAALDRAVALAEVQLVAVIVDDDLSFDVPRILQVLLDVHGRIPEVSVGFSGSTLERLVDVARRTHDAETLAAATVSRLDGHGKPHLVPKPGDFTGCPEGLERPGHGGHLGLFGCETGRDLVTHHCDRRGRWADPDHPGLADLARKLCVFSEESVTGMNCFGAGLRRHPEDGRHVQV